MSRRDPEAAGSAPGNGVGTLGGHSLVYAFSSFLGQLGTLLTFPLYTRALGVQEYGVLALALSASGVLRTLVIAGTNTALMHERISADRDDVPRVTAAAALWVVVAAVLFGAAGAVFVDRMGTRLSIGLDVSLIVAIAVFVGFDSLYELTLAAARADARPAAYAMANGLRIGITFCSAALLFALTDAQSIGAVLGMALGSAGAAVWLASRLELRFALRGCLAWIPRLLGEGLPLVPANLASWISNLSDRYLLLLFLGSTTVVGVYSAGYRVGTLITALFVGPFHTAFLPFMLRNLRTSQDDGAYRDASRLFLVMGSIAVCLLQAFSVPIVRILAGPQYEGAERIVGVVALGSLLCGAAMLMTPVAIKAGRSHVVAIAFGAGAAANLAINVWLIPVLGMSGAAAATLAGYACVMVAALLFTPVASRPPGFVTTAWRVVPLMSLATVPSLIDYGGPFEQFAASAALSIFGLAALVAARVVDLGDLWQVVRSLGQSVTRMLKSALPHSSGAGRWLRQVAFVVRRAPQAIALLRGARRRARGRGVGAIGVVCRETPYLRYLRETPEALARVVSGVDRIVAGEMVTFGRCWQWESDADWHLDAFSGRRWARLPSGIIDVNFVRADSDVQSPWETSRLEHVWRVAVAYAASGDEAYAAWVVERLASWQRANRVGWGVNWTVSMEVALRAIAISEICACVQGSPHWIERVARDVYLLLADHVEWALDNLEHYGSGTQNHYLASLVGIYAIDAHFSGWDALHERTAWVYPALMECVRVQVNPDGVNFENSLGYHLLVCELVGYALGVAHTENRAVPDDVALRFAGMLEYAAAMEFGDGSPVAIGDDDDDYLLPSVASYYDTERPGVAAHLDYMAHVAGLGVRDVQRCATLPCAFPDGGVAVLGDARHRIIVNAMPTGVNGRGPHRHNDALSFLVEADGRPILVDCGTYRYQSSGNDRDRYRSVVAHNTVQVDGLEQNVFSGLFALECDRIEMSDLVTRFDGPTQHASAMHHGFVEDAGLVHARSWDYDPRDSRCVVLDTIGPADPDVAGGPHRFTARFHFATGLSAVMSSEPDGGSLTVRCGACELSISTPGGERLEAAFVDSSYAPRYRVEVPATALEVTWQARGETSLATVLRFIDSDGS